MPTLVVTHPDGRDEALELHDELTIGRADENGLVLRGKGVSRMHARVFVQDDGHVYVEDAGSANGTFVNGQRVADPTRLLPSEPLVIGDYTLMLRSVGHSPGRGSQPLDTSETTDASAHGGAAEPASEAGAPLVLRGMVGQWLNQQFELKALQRVGRSSEADIQIDDVSVSRRHAELEVKGGKVLLRDLGASNGTLVNGEPVEGETEVLPGDVLTFGTIELVLEAPRASARMRRAAANGPVSDLTEDEGGPKSGAWILLAVLAVAVGAAAIIGVWKTLSGPVPEPPVAVASAARGTKMLADPTAQFNAALSECRTYSAIEVGVEPDWERAQAACNRALDLDPIHAEAMQLEKKVKRERDAFQAFQQGEKALARNNEEDALQALSAILPESGYYARAKGLALDAAERVMKATGANCRRYSNAARWREAVRACTQYMDIACQEMEADDLNPPPNHRLVLRGRLRANQWRPKDPNHIRLLVALEKLDQRGAAWSCPSIPILKKTSATTDQRAEMEKTFEERYPDKVLSGALLNYWLGRGTEACVALARLGERTDKAELHEQAARLQRDISTVDQLFKTGQGALQNEDPDRAAKLFQEAMDLDAQLMGSATGTRPSHYRKNMQQDMASAAYLKGVHWADRQDLRRACRYWKLGFSFYQANPDLNKAVVNVCSAKGSSELEAARSCDDLQGVLELAVEGDGLKQKVEVRKKELECPP